MVMREGEAQRLRDQLGDGGDDVERGSGDGSGDAAGAGAVVTSRGSGKVPSPSPGSTHRTQLLTRGGMTMDQLSLYPPGTIMHLVSPAPAT